MRDYATIGTNIWRSEKFRSLKSDSQRVLYFYIHSCSHANSVGCFLLPLGYIITDLRWSEAEVIDGIDTLCETGLIRYTYGIDTVYITDFLAHDPIKNPKHGAGALKIARSLPDSEEKLLLLNDLEKSPHIDTAEVRYLIDTVSIPYAYQNQNQNQSSKTISPKSDQLDLGTDPVSDISSDGFDEFWAGWPTDLGEKGNKKRARSQWCRLRPDAAMVALMTASLDAQAKAKRHLRANQVFCPNFQHVERWIRDRGWESEIPIEFTHAPDTQELID